MRTLVLHILYSFQLFLGHLSPSRLPKEKRAQARVMGFSLPDVAPGAELDQIVHLALRRVSKTGVLWMESPRSDTRAMLQKAKIRHSGYDGMVSPYGSRCNIAEARHPVAS
jgi:hypothetical protein